MIKIKLLKIQFYLFIFSSFALNYNALAQSSNIVLGRPTNNSITASVMFDVNKELFIEYGTQSGLYTNTTSPIINVSGIPDEIDLINLEANTRYYYRLHHRTPGNGAYTISDEYTFHTQRAPGSSFTFTLEADEHLYDKKGIANMYKVCLENQANDQPDFMLSLGDIFGDDHNPDSITSGALDTLHKNYRPFLQDICHSIPFYVCLGNHEGENDYYLAQNPPNNLAINGTLWRKVYFPNPYPNDFYTGNTDVEPYGVGNPENYYAWNWGDALFVVLDVYRDECDTSAKPQKWAWSLGLPQYTWLKNTLESSSAPYKFVFAHHVRGQGRGGVTNAPFFEWGGYEQNGTSYTFPTKRPGWAKPIHQLFVDNGVNIFFQGHDHVFAHEVLDGITYQALPMAADSTYEIGMLANADAYVSDTLDGTGHLRVTVAPSCVQVDYVRAYLPADTVSGEHHNGEVAFSYTIGDCAPLSIPVQTKLDEIKVLPNPTQDVFRVQFANSPSKCRLKLINALGQVISQVDGRQLNVQEFPSGMYFLSIETEAGTNQKRVIIAH